MSIKTNKEIMKEISNDLGIELKVVKVVMNSFFKTLRTFIRMRFAVKIHGYFRFYPKKQKYPK